MIQRLRRLAGAGRHRAAAPPEPQWQWPLRLEGTTPTGVHVVLRPLAVDDGPVF